MTQPTGHAVPSSKNHEEILARAALLPGWTVAGRTELRKNFTFGNFLQGLKFVNQVAQIAESAQHHPDLLLRYGGVSVMLTTHDAGGLTELDLALAKAIDEIVRTV